MKLNREKTEGIWLGSLKDSPNEFCSVKFTKKAVRILGLYVGHDKEECNNENWLKKIQKIKNCIHIWKSRKLSI